MFKQVMDTVLIVTDKRTNTKAVDRQEILKI